MRRDSSVPREDRVDTMVDHRPYQRPDWSKRGRRSFGSILPRSRLLLLASTEGSRIEKVNKNRVRLWTGCSTDQNGEIEARSPSRAEMRR
jgi:hypothetical protein